MLFGVASGFILRLEESIPSHSLEMNHKLFYIHISWDQTGLSIIKPRVPRFPWILLFWGPIYREAVKFQKWRIHLAKSAKSSCFSWTTDINDHLEWGPDSASWFDYINVPFQPSKWIRRSWTTPAIRLPAIDQNKRNRKSDILDYGCQSHTRALQTLQKGHDRAQKESMDLHGVLDSMHMYS